MKSLSEIIAYGAVSALLISPVYADSITIPLEIKKNGNYLLVGGGISNKTYGYNSRIYNGHIKTRKNAPKSLAKMLEKIGLYDPKIALDFSGNIKTNVGDSIENWNDKMAKIHKEVKNIEANASELQDKLNNLDEEDKKKIAPYLNEINTCASQYLDKKINESEFICRLESIEKQTGTNKSISKNILEINQSKSIIEQKFFSSDGSEPIVFEGDFSLFIELQMKFDKFLGLF